MKFQDVFTPEVAMAGRIWGETLPESCRCWNHIGLDGEPLQDNEVCPRERAWRMYVKLRDERISNLLN